MIFYKIIFGACLLLLCISYAALMAAHKKGDKRQARVLHFFRLGLSFSALSYLLRILDPASAGRPSFLIVASCLAGTILIWIGWKEHWQLRWERLKAQTHPRPAEEGAEEPALEPPVFLSRDPGWSRLNARARQVLLDAQDEARRRQEGAVDTEHLLLALLREPQGDGVRLLHLLGVQREEIGLELGRNVLGDAEVLQDADRLELTERAHQVIALAAQEAHRFNAGSIGTEHLLLGLLLVGKGAAAGVLFQEGVTVDRIRDAIITRKRAGVGTNLEK